MRNVANVLLCDLPQLPVGATERFMLEQMAAVSELGQGYQRAHESRPESKVCP